MTVSSSANFQTLFPVFLSSSDAIQVKKCSKNSPEVVYVVMEKVGAFDVMRPYATPAVLSPLPTESYSFS